MENKIHQILHLVLRLNNSDLYKAHFEYRGTTKGITVIIHHTGNFEDQVFNKYFYCDIITECNADIVIEELAKRILEVPDFNFAQA